MAGPKRHLMPRLASTLGCRKGCLPTLRLWFMSSMVYVLRESQEVLLDNTTARWVHVSLQIAIPHHKRVNPAVPQPPDLE